MPALSSRFTTIATFFVGLAAVMAFVTIATRPRPASPIGEGINDWIGRPAPDFTLPDRKGVPVTLSSFKGKVVVLDLWATWCPQCVAELPINAAVAKKFADRGVAFYAVNVGEPFATVESFLADLKLDITVLLDTQTDVAMHYDAEYIPLLVVIDADGKIVARDNVDPAEAETTLTTWIESALKSGQAAGSGTERPATRP